MKSRTGRIRKRAKERARAAPCGKGNTIGAANRAGRRSVRAAGPGAVGPFPPAAGGREGSGVIPARARLNGIGRTEIGISPLCSNRCNPGTRNARPTLLHDIAGRPARSATPTGNAPRLAPRERRPARTRCCGNDARLSDATESGFVQFICVAKMRRADDPARRHAFTRGLKAVADDEADVDALMAVQIEVGVSVGIAVLVPAVDLGQNAQGRPPFLAVIAEGGA